MRTQKINKSIWILYNAGTKNVGKLFDFHLDVECGNQICKELQIFTTMYDLKPVAGSELQFCDEY